MRNLLLFMSMCMLSITSYAQLNCNNVNASMSLSASGATVTLTNNSTPTATSNIYTYYQINWGDNSAITYVYNSNASQQHAYTASGTYTVTLYSNVLDSINNIQCYDTATGSISVTVPPLNCNNVNASMNISIQGGGSMAYLTNNSTPVGGMNLSVQYHITWGDGGNITTSSKSPQSHTYTSNGTYNIRLIVTVYDSANSIGCNDTANATVNITNTGFNCSNVNAAYTQSTNGLVVTTTNLSTPNPGSGVNASYTYFWGDGNSTTKTNKSSTAHTYSANGGYTIKLVATYTSGNTTCVDSVSDTVVINNTPPPNVIAGSIHVDSNSTVDSYKVWLINFDSATNILSAVDSQTVAVFAGNGYYSFSSKAAGSYRTKAARLNGPISGTGYVPTYHDSDLLWSNANVIVHTGGSSYGKDIYMKKGTVTSGPGFVGGNVTQGANKGTGSGIAGMNILILDANNKVITYAITDANGDYSFPNLPIGSYKVHPEFLGYATTPATLDITNAKQSQSAINFERSTSQKTITPLPQSISNVNNAQLAFMVYPNPAKDVVTINWATYSDDMATVTITDISGKKVLAMQAQMNANASINVSDLQTGFYFLNVASELGDNTQKLIVE